MANIPLFTPSWGAVGNVTPFTHRDNATYLTMLHDLSEYLTVILIPTMNAEFTEQRLASTTEVLGLLNDVNALIETLNTTNTSAEDALLQTETFFSDADEYIALNAVNGHSWWKTDTPITLNANTNVLLVVDPYRPRIIGDLVSDTTENTNYGRVVAVIDDANATVEYIGSIRGASGSDAVADPAVAELINTSTSDTRTALEATFDAKRTVNLITDYGADPTGTIAANTALQSAFDYLAANDGATLYVPPGEFRLTRTPDGTANQMYAATISQGTVFGAGDASHIYLDSTSVNPTRYYLIRIGTQTTGTTAPVSISGLRMTGNESIIGGASVMGIAARHDDAGTRDLISSDDVSISNVKFYDVAVGVGCTKEGASAHNSPENRFKRWYVDRISVFTCSNKAVEFGDSVDAYLGNSYFSDVGDGPQAVFNSAHVWFVSNVVYYNTTGINIAHGCEDFWIIDNYVEADTTTPASAALIFRAEDQAGSTTTIKRGVVRGNTLVNNGTSYAPLSFFLQVRSTITSLTVKDVLFDGNYFAARTHLYDAADPAKNIVSGLHFVNNRFAKVLAVATTASQVEHVTLTRNTFEELNTISGGSKFDLESNIFKNGLTLGYSTSDFTSYRDLTNTGLVTNNGTGNSVTATRTYTP